MFSKKLVLSALAVALLATSGVSFARRGADDPVPHPRGEGAGHPNSVDASEMILARRGADDPVGSERPGDNHRQRRGGRAIEDASEMILARRGADDPVGSERPGEVHGQRRGGRNSVESMIIAREASEAPRGADNNNQRRRGRA